MLEGLEIVIARMETNPEEFINGDWDYFTDHMAYDLFTEEECIELEKAKIKLQEVKLEFRRKRYTTEVLERLVEDKNKWEAVKKKEGRQHMKDVLSAGVENIAKQYEYKWAEVIKDVQS
jgi:cupin superfamily acireductone dioxygenase involved in methionine salvage